MIPLTKPSSMVLTLSGGLDSTVLAAWAKSHGHKVRCLSVDYGQRHHRELFSAMAVAKALGLEHKTINLSALREIMGGSSQTSPDIAVPLGHYAEESMKLTVVPNRNMILLALAGAWAVATKSEYVAYAAHTGDHAIYPDCRPEFADAMGKALGLCDWHQVAIFRPFIALTKGEIVKIGERVGAPMHLTWTCYEGGEVHCGRCGSCTERREAFEVAGVPDPTGYAAKSKMSDLIKER